MAGEDATAGPRVRTRVEAGIGHLTLDNPKVNVLTIPVMEQAVAALAALEADAAAKLIVVEAAGTRAFSAGVDVADHTPEKMDHMLRVFHDLCLGLHRSPKPTVAAVRRMALGGGCELAAFCDLAVASDQATFGQPEIKVGVYPVLGAALFTGMVGPKTTNEILLTGSTYGAGEACALGLVNRVWPDERFDEELAAYLAVLAANSGVVMSLTKKAILASAGKEPDAALAAAERVYVHELMTTADANEGLAAFIEKRPPVWKEA